ncbi:MAG: winged helix-turn-helix transcriptional regulator, partial [Candidatus Heimdallarchaeota archaeon]|nr:winged helix-turn-helix transcriptional regulator [Candidatus Heimdallarchaeota archaeon]
MNSKKQTPEIWKALSNKIRRDLLCFIGDKRVVSFTEIQERFQMKVGTLYHHLDTLGELITQDSTKKYMLTEKGRRSYALIEDELDVTAPSLPTYGKMSFLHSVFLRPVFHFIGNDSIRSLGFSILLLVGLGVATYFLSFTPIFLFPSFIVPDFFAPIFF